MAQPRIAKGPSECPLSGNTEERFNDLILSAKLTCINVASDVIVQLISPIMSQFSETVILNHSGSVAKLQALKSKP